ncbi:MAG: acetylglutamate kinase, partial [Hadesarchaea archaeon]
MSRGKPGDGLQEPASVLLEALPYIRKFHGQTMVIKLGGEVIEKKKTLDSLLQDVVLLHYVGMKPVLVHGGGPEITREMKKAGKEPEFVAGLRVTDKETIEILHKYLVGKLNTEIVLGINKYGGRAVGISGVDGKIILAKKIREVTTPNGEKLHVDLGFVGEIERIDPHMVSFLLSNGYIPVLSPLGVDEEGRSLNLNADTVAAELAIVMGAKKLIVLTNVKGVLRDPKDESTLISQLTVEEAKTLLASGVVSGGMIPKLKACIRAVEG